MLSLINKNKINRISAGELQAEIYFMTFLSMNRTQISRVWSVQLPVSVGIRKF
jgi:hypothetical protein